MRKLSGRDHRDLCVCVCAGVDVILDFVGASYWEKHVQCVAVDGRVVHLGLVSL